MIQTFADKPTAALFTGLHVRRLPAAIQIRARAKLLTIHAATTLDDLRIPTSNHLELLRGDRATQYSVRITTSGVSVLRGAKATPTMLKLLITTKEAHQ